jgi:pimeloyl-ACP methyl ester carboxylesterase
MLRSSSIPNIEHPAPDATTQPGSVTTAAAASLLVADGARLRYVDRGHGDPIVLIHGFPGNLDYSWTRAIDLFAARHRVIAMDMLGFGWSDRPRTADYGRPAEASRIAELLDALEVSGATVVGVSYGGGVAEHLAAMRPDLVSRLVLLSAEDASVRCSLLDSTRELRIAFAVIGLPIIGLRIGRTFAREQGTPDRRDDDSVDVAVLPLRRPWTFGWLGKLFADLRRERLLDLARIGVPTLVISSDGDDTIPPSIGEAIVAKIPGARHIVLSGLPHGFWGDQPELLAQELTRVHGGGAQAGT